MTTMALQVRDDARLAGRVLRYHTWPHIKEQSVAEHSWQLLRILLAIWPEAPQHVLSYIVRHDCGELTTGDAPYPVKANNPILGKEMNRVERDGLMLQIEAGFLRLGPDVDEQEKWAVKLAEFIEMWEWGAEELLMGNQFARLVSQRCRKVAEDKIHQILDDSRYDQIYVQIALEAQQYMNRRKKLWEL